LLPDFAPGTLLGQFPPGNGFDPVLPVLPLLPPVVDLPTVPLAMLRIVSHELVCMIYLSIGSDVATATNVEKFNPQHPLATGQIF
jgi:hypothetical protein